MKERRYKCLICDNTDRFKAVAQTEVEIIVDGSGNLINIDMDQMIDNSQIEIQRITDCIKCGASGPESIVDLNESTSGDKKE